MKTLMTLCFILISIIAFPQKGQLKGHVSDIEDSSDFAGLNIYLISNGVEITLTNTNKKGVFYIKDIPYGTYDLIINFVGLRDKIIRNIQIEDSLKTENLFFPDNCKILQTKCPYDHTDNIIPVFYGYADKKTIKKQRSGEILIGAYVKTECSPNFYCKKHKVLF